MSSMEGGSSYVRKVKLVKLPWEEKLQIKSSRKREKIVNRKAHTQQKAIINKSNKGKEIKPKIELETQERKLGQKLNQEDVLQRRR